MYNNKFIVLEGLDGAGKSTQIRKLTNYLSEKGEKYKYLHFPRTEAPFFGELVSKFLRGEFGDLNQVDPYLVALIYAGDRHHAKDEVREWLDKDYYVIIDRYVYSNIGFQCAKVADKGERVKLRNWIVDLEYDHYQIPKPGKTLFLDVPFSFTKTKLTQERKGEDREYLKGKKDIHEADLDFQTRVRDVYLDLKLIDDKYTIVECFDENDLMLQPDQIFHRIKNALEFN